MRNKLATAVLLIASVARADDPAALAQSLFDEGRKLANEQNNWTAACPKFAESHRLKPGGGVVLNLALCYRKTGRTASAYARYKEGLAFAVRDKNDARLKIANDGIAELEPLLSYLTVIVQSDEPELAIELDGQPIPRAAWGSRFPVDPGKRVLEARAPRKKPFRAELTVEETADQKTIEVPALENAPAPPPPPRDEVVTIEHPTKRTVGLLAAGVGVVGLGLGSYFGVRALSTKSRSDDECVQGCSQLGADLSRDAVRFGNLSTVSFAASVVLLSAGAYLFFTSTEKRTVRAPGLALGRDHAVFSLIGTF